MYLLEKTREMATKEAEVIINASKEKATMLNLQKLLKREMQNYLKCKSNIDTNFDEAVKHVVSTVLKV